MITQDKPINNRKKSAPVYKTEVLLINERRGVIIDVMDNKTKAGKGGGDDKIDVTDNVQDGE